MQLLVTIILIAAAAGYALWRVVRIVRDGKTPCDGCELKKNCQKFGHYKEKHYLCNR